MDFELPSNEAIANMAREYEKLHIKSRAQAIALAVEGSKDATIIQDALPKTSPTSALALLFLYFIAHMRYNMSHGIEISYADRGLGGVLPVGSAFGKLNNLVPNG